MIGLEDRRNLARDIDAAHQAGARLRLACETAGIELRTLQRWKANGGAIRFISARKATAKETKSYL